MTRHRLSSFEAPRTPLATLARTRTPALLLGTMLGLSTAITGCYFRMGSQPQPTPPPRGYVPPALPPPPGLPPRPRPASVPATMGRVAAKGQLKLPRQPSRPGAVDSTTVLGPEPTNIPDDPTRMLGAGYDTVTGEARPPCVVMPPRFIFLGQPGARQSTMTQVVESSVAVQRMEAEQNSFGLGAVIQGIGLGFSAQSSVVTKVSSSRWSRADYIAVDSEMTVPLGAPNNTWFLTPDALGMLQRGEFWRFYRRCGDSFVAFEARGSRARLLLNRDAAEASTSISQNDKAALNANVPLTGNASIGTSTESSWRSAVKQYASATSLFMEGGKEYTVDPYAFASTPDRYAGFSNSNAMASTVVLRRQAVAYSSSVVANFPHATPAESYAIDFGQSEASLARMACFRDHARDFIERYNRVKDKVASGSATPRDRESVDNWEHGDRHLLETAIACNKAASSAIQQCLQYLDQQVAPLAQDVAAHCSPATGGPSPSVATPLPFGLPGFLPPVPQSYGAGSPLRVCDEMQSIHPPRPTEMCQ